MLDKEKAFCTDSKTNTNVLLNRLYQTIDRTTRLDPHSSLIISSHHFIDPYPFVNDIGLFSLATMDLNIQFAYPFISGYAKLSITYTMMRSYGEVCSFTIGPAIPLTNSENDFLPMSEVYTQVSRLMLKQAETKEILFFES